MTTLSHITAAVENNAIIMSTRVTRSRRYWPKCVRERALQASERHQSIIIMTMNRIAKLLRCPTMLIQVDCNIVSMYFHWTIFWSTAKSEKMSPTCVNYYDK